MSWISAEEVFPPKKGIFIGYGEDFIGICSDPKMDGEKIVVTILDVTKSSISYLNPHPEILLKWRSFPCRDIRLVKATLTQESK